MKSNDRAILAVLALIGVAAGFWFMVLAPKREQASRLAAEVGELRSQVAEANSQAAAGKEAQRDFPVKYRRLVVLGKAIPEDADT